MDRSTLNRLLADLEREGAIDAGQRELLARRIGAALPPPADRTGRFVTIVAALGALLVGAGIVLFVAANWADLGRGAKLALVFGALLGIHHYGYALAEEPGRHPRIGRALTFLGVLAFGGAIGLVGQVYHLPGDLERALLVWWALSVPFALLTRSPWIVALVLALFTIWAFLATGEHLARLERIEDVEALGAFALLAVALGALVKGLVCVTRMTGDPDLEAPLRALGAPFVIGGVYALSFRFPFEAGPLPIAAAVALPAALAGAAALLLFALALRKPAARTDAVDGLALLGAGAALFATLRLAPDRTWPAANVLLLVGLLGLIARGVQRNLAVYVNYGVLGFLLLVITRYFEYLYERVNEFWLFIGAGLILFGMGAWLERRRRRWVGPAREAAT